MKYYIPLHGKSGTFNSLSSFCLWFKQCIRPVYVPSVHCVRSYSNSNFTHTLSSNHKQQPPRWSHSHSLQPPCSPPSAWQHQWLKSLLKSTLLGATQPALFRSAQAHHHTVPILPQPHTVTLPRARMACHHVVRTILTHSRRTAQSPTGMSHGPGPIAARQPLPARSNLFSLQIRANWFWIVLEWWSIVLLSSSNGAGQNKFVECYSCIVWGCISTKRYGFWDFDPKKSTFIHGHFSSSRVLVKSYQYCFVLLIHDSSPNKVHWRTQ